MMRRIVIAVEIHYMTERYLISIVGPTAIGKTALSIKLAQHFNTEILSADSRQFYKEMSIGTAVPSPEELDAAKHHFIQHKSIEDDYTVGDFERDAIEVIQGIHKQHPMAIMVGGSGLYVKAVTKGLDDFPEVDKAIRLKLNETLQNEGLISLQTKLKELDILTYETIAIDNPQRVIRALEICIGTNKPYSSFLTNPEKKRPFKIISIGLDADRSVIYDRINRRVDLMIENGLLKEAERLFPFRHLNALNTVGYKELFQYLEGHWSLDIAISEIKKNTRRFAKRQLTWFRKDPHIQWFNFEADLEGIVEYIQDKT